MQRFSGSVVRAQHRQHFRVAEGIAPTSHNDQQFLVSAAPFQGDVKPVGNLRLEIGVGHDRHLTYWWRFLNPLFASVSVSAMPLFAGGRRHSLQEPSPLRLAGDHLAVDGQESTCRLDRPPLALDGGLLDFQCGECLAFGVELGRETVAAGLPLLVVLGAELCGCGEGCSPWGLRRSVTCWCSAPPPLFESATIRSSVTGRLLWQKE